MVIRKIEEEVSSHKFLIRIKQPGLSKIESLLLTKTGEMMIKIPGGGEIKARRLSVKKSGNVKGNANVRGKDSKEGKEVALKKKLTKRELKIAKKVIPEREIKRNLRRSEGSKIKEIVKIGIKLAGKMINRGKRLRSIKKKKRIVTVKTNRVDKLRMKSHKYNQLKNQKTFVHF